MKKNSNNGSITKTQNIFVFSWQSVQEEFSFIYKIGVMD